MHHFNYRENELYCEDVPVRKIAAEIGTPFYLYSHATLTRHFKAFNEAFEGMDRLVCFSAKANTNLAILRLFAALGCGLDIVSGGELYRGIQAGFAPNRIVYSGIGKRIDEIETPDGAKVEQLFSGDPLSQEQVSMKWDGEWQITYEVFRDLGTPG